MSLDGASGRHHRPGSGMARPGHCLAAILAGAVTAIGLASCSSAKPAPARQETLGCYTGPFELKASPGAAGKGQLVALSASGKWPVSDTVHDVGTESYGLLGTADGGRFVAKYNLGAIAQGVQREPNSPVGGSNALGGVGLPNRPFRIEVPAVSAGSYLVEFTYTVTPSGGGKPRQYHLCAPLTVTAN